MFASVLRFIEKRLANPVLFAKTQMKVGLFGERPIATSAKILRVLIYAYIIIGVITVIIRRKSAFILKWPRILMTYFHFK